MKNKKKKKKTFLYQAKKLAILSVLPYFKHDR